MSATDDYSKALVEPETDIRNELGTGNISMSVYDLNKFFTSVLSGDIIPKEILFSLWQNNGDKHPTAAVFTVEMIISCSGKYHRFHAVAAMKKDTKDAIVMESNIQSDKNIKLPATDLRNQIYELMEGVNLKAKSRQKNQQDAGFLGSIIYGTDESELILQPHFLFRY